MQDPKIRQPQRQLTPRPRAMVKHKAEGKVYYLKLIQNQNSAKNSQGEAASDEAHACKAIGVMWTETSVLSRFVRETTSFNSW